MLKIRNVTKWFGSHRVLDDVSLDVARGERVVVLGENGCGKSTLLQIVSGVIDADEGDVRLPDSEDRGAKRSGLSFLRGFGGGAPIKVGYAPEKPDIPDHLLAREWLDLVASLKRARVITNELGVSELLGRKVGALSLGQRQRVSLVAAFTGEPPLLVLDEPTNALDASSREAVIARLRDATALVATHDRDFADRVATRVIRLAA